MGKSPVPVDFRIDAEMRKWAEEKVPLVNIDVETEKFVDYWRANGRMMHDWVASWRTWIRNAATFRGGWLYSADEIQVKRLMDEFGSKGFRRAYTHENAVTYRVAF